MKSKIGAIVFDLKESFEDLGHEIKNIQERLSIVEEKINNILKSSITNNKDKNINLE
ncbi:MAG TPA: hypothetical protein P5556_02270 [Candidatus Gastranaerophilales bacterium]|nr:hypothetical protein [Candidatus Gastranaerophilales bacterium]